MKKSLKPFLFTFASSVLFANEFQVEEYEHTEPCECMHTFCITPSAWRCNTSQAPYVSLEFLYLKSYEEDLIFTDFSEFIDNPLPLDVYNKSLQNLDFDWNPAFRIGIGYQLPCDGWDLYLAWMYHYTNPSRTVSSDTPNLTLLITSDEGHESENDGSPYATRAREEWKLTYNAITAELARHYYISSCISFRPFVGAKAAFIDQSLHVDYDDLFFVSFNGMGPFIGNQTYRGTGDFWGVGPRVGIDTKWYLGCNFNLAADVSGTLFVGSFCSHATIKNENDPTSDLNPVLQKIKQQDRTEVRANADLRVGIEWGCCFCECYALDIALGYEMQYFWKQMQIPYPGLAYPDADLSFHGINASLRLSF